MKNFLRPILAFTKANLLGYCRDKVYIFFMLVLPVMFLLIFGMMYRNEFSSFRVAVFNESKTEFASRFVEEMTSEEDGVIDKKDVKDRADAEEKLIRGELDAIIVVPSSFGEPNEQGLPSGELEVVYSKNAEQAGQTVSAVLDRAVAEISSAMTGYVPPLTVRSEVLAREGLSTFDYVFAGLLGYTVMTVGMLGVANAMPSEKQSGALRRLRATTISSAQLVMGYALTFLAIGVVTFAVMIALGILVFDFTMRGNWFVFAAFLTMATLMMLGFGMAIGGFAKTEPQASSLANIVMFPMMFLSGVFFPMFMMPEIVQKISTFIPLTPIVEGTRLIITENYSLLDVMPQIGMIAAWGVIIYVIAVRTFRWE
jgi:ABC-2 type transport system permease protein